MGVISVIHGFEIPSYSTGNERQTSTGGSISGQTYLGFTKNKHSAEILSPRANPHKLFSFQL